MSIEELRTHLRRRLSSYVSVRLPDSVLAAGFPRHMLKVFADTIHGFRQTHGHKLPAFPAHYWEVQAFAPEERAVLTYYYPLVPSTRESSLLGHCLSTALRTPVKVVRQEKYDKKIIFDGASLGMAILDYDAVPAGSVPDKRINFQVQVGPIKTEQLPYWVQGGRKRWFLENGLLPLWLTENEIYSIILIPEKNTSCLSEPGMSAYLDLNLQMM